MQFKESQLSEAIDLVYQKASLSSLIPTFTDSYYNNLGNVYSKIKGQIDEAEECYREAIKNKTGLCILLTAIYYFTMNYNAPIMMLKQLSLNILKFAKQIVEPLSFGTISITPMNVTLLAS